MRRTLFAGATLGVLAAATAAHAQNTWKAFTQPAVTGQDRPTDLSLAVSHDKVVLVGNDSWQLSDKDGSNRVVVGLDPGATLPIPFVKRLTGSDSLFDPRAEYDIIRDRFVIVMSEFNFSNPIVHVMISKNGSPNSFTAADWHIYTGPDAFLLSGGGVGGLADHATVAIDADYIYLCLVDKQGVTIPFPQWAIVLPIVHSGGSLYSGQRVAETEMSYINFNTISLPLRPAPDRSSLHGSVMETSVYSDTRQFFITTNDPPLQPDPGPPVMPHHRHEAIRLGVLIETTDPAGSRPATFDYRFFDMAVPGVPSFWDADSHRPTTLGGPTIEYRAPLGSKIETAVRHRDPQGNDSIYAVHEYEANAGGSAVADFTSRWYIIDPDAANAGMVSWNPTIVQTGVIPEPPMTQQDTYHSAIAVNNLGQLGLSWTASDAAIHPQMEYGLFNPASSTLTQGVHNTGGQPAGPWMDQDDLTNGRWADYSDIQLDPTGCRFYAACTLIGTTPGSITNGIEDRDAWIGTIPFSCFTTDMNMSGSTDTYDMMMYTDYYTTGDTRADTDADGEVDAIDMLNYIDAYDAATGP